MNRNMARIHLLVLKRVPLSHPKQVEGRKEEGVEREHRLLLLEPNSSQNFFFFWIERGRIKKSVMFLLLVQSLMGVSNERCKLLNFDS